MMDLIDMLRFYSGIAFIVCLFVLLAVSGCERAVDHPRFHMVTPIPVDADTAYCEIGKHGGRILIGSMGDPKTFNPVVSSETSSGDITARMFDPMVGLDNSTMEDIPGLAKSWEHTEDGLIWTFHLRRGLLWSDGHPLTAYDVEFTFNDVIYNPDIPNNLNDILRVNGKKFEVMAVDSLTVVVKLPDIYAPSLRFIGGVPIIPRHVLMPEVERGEFSSAYGLNWPPEKLVSSGPFLLESFESGIKTVLRRNPNYWRVDPEGNRLPYLERVIFVNLRSMETMFLTFQVGEMDMLVGVRPQDIPILKRDEEKRDFTVHNLGPSLGQNMFWFNVNPGKNKEGKPYVAPYKRVWFENVVFRKAIAHAVDREGIIHTVLNGMAKPQYGPESFANKRWYNPDVVKYPYDLTRARGLLYSIGYLDRDGDGWREDPEGNTIEFTLITNTGNDVRELIGNIIKDDMTKIGINMIFSPIEFNTLITKIDAEYDYECCLLGLTSGDPDPSSGMSVWLSSGRMHQWYPDQETPSTEWEARIDSLMNLQITTLDMAKRKTYYDEVQYIVSDMVPYIYLVIPDVHVASKNNIGNFKPTILRHRTLWNADELYLKY